jgi:hypothetical protein
MPNPLPAAKSDEENASRIASDAETAEYIGDLAGQLERLARTHGLVRLQYLLSVCREEAEKIANGG